MHFFLCRILTRAIDSYAKRISCVDIGRYHQSEIASIDWLMKFLFVTWGMFLIVTCSFLHKGGYCILQLKIDLGYTYWSNVLN